MDDKEKLDKIEELMSEFDNEIIGDECDLVDAIRDVLDGKEPPVFLGDHHEYVDVE